MRLLFCFCDCFVRFVSWEGRCNYKKRAAKERAITARGALALLNIDDAELVLPVAGTVEDEVGAEAVPEEALTLVPEAVAAALVPVAALPAALVMVELDAEPEAGAVAAGQSVILRAPSHPPSELPMLQSVPSA